MQNDGDEIRYRGVRKRKWGKYVAEIRSGKRSRISLGSYFTPQAAARAYDAALLCLRGPNATSFNFPDSKFNSIATQVAGAHTNPSAQVIRAAAIAVGSSFDINPGGDDGEAGPSTAAGASVEDIPAEASIQSREAVRDETHHMAEAEESDLKYLLESPEHISFEESVQLPPFQADLQVAIEPHNQSELFPYSNTSDASPKPLP
ncbi:hypothetical protein SUGI_0297550 [Cryptomeria japonica]|uniref:ethylene-responsive transcription factor ERF017-like n=1 Tax=Cryptomeria japonica TaxID=3369 RepID=UPI002408C11F|nr:ethylene-responsive transcription factor ERF017-like [Cryptomeria japonica]GLJ17184.1 hypothetical protein SUGI_0297550 [Cryptomeria japonica]